VTAIRASRRHLERRCRTPRRVNRRDAGALFERRPCARRPRDPQDRVSG
jgi:hypothetical protein